MVFLVLFIAVAIFAFWSGDVVIAGYLFVFLAIFAFFVTELLPRLNALGV